MARWTSSRRDWSHSAITESSASLSQRDLFERVDDLCPSTRSDPTARIALSPCEEEDRPPAATRRDGVFPRKG
eukprot:1193403-Prorocentrum_minimum.AAC.2